MMQITLQLKHLRAMAHLAGKEGCTRPQLAGVWIDADENTVLMATTGEIMGVLNVEQHFDAPFRLLVPHAAIKALAKAKGAVVLACICENTWSADASGVPNVWVDEHPNQMPDWRRVIPKSPFSGVAQQFDLSLVQAFTKTAVALGSSGKGTSVLIHHNGGGGDLAALVQIPGEPMFVGVAMALRSGICATMSRAYVPSWVA